MSTISSAVAESQSQSTSTPATLSTSNSAVSSSSASSSASSSSPKSSSSSAASSSNTNASTLKKANTRAIACQLRKLAGDVEGAAFLSAEPACLAGLLSLINADENKEQETLLIALQAVLLLATHQSSRQALSRQSNFSVRLATLASCEQQLVAAAAQAALDAIHIHANQSAAVKADTSSNVSNSSGRASVASRSSRGPSYPGHNSRKSMSSAAVHSSATTSSPAPERTGTRYLSTLTLLASRKGFGGGGAELLPNERSALEQRLIAVHGVVSVSVSRQGVVTMHCKVGSDLEMIEEESKDKARPTFSIVIPTAAMLATALNACENASSLTNISSSPSSSSLCSPAPSSSPVLVDSTTTPSKSQARRIQASDQENVTGDPAKSKLTWSSSRAIIVAANSVEGASLQSRFQSRRQQAVHNQEKQHVAKGLFSAVTSYFW